MIDKFNDNYGREKYKLKPCPFCGAIPMIIFKDLSNGRDTLLISKGYDVYCGTSDCYLQHGADWLHDDRIDAAEMWNKRI